MATVCIPSSSSVPVQQKHQVFLSFRGEDTRTTFTSHLRSALDRKGIGYFFDNQLVRGEEISQALLKAIEESKISIIVLSKNYASSSWCLNELCKILECKESGQIVVPIFYHVDPSDVRQQKGSFAEAFAEHVEKRAADIVERWRAALAKVAGLSGHDAKKDRCEVELIKDIVEDISKKLIHKSSNDFKDRLVGIDSHIKQIESMLAHVQILGIWGMGGIGKTTIAEAIFQRIFYEHKFECCSIRTNVREKSKTYGWIPLRDELLREILDTKDLIIGTALLPSFVYVRLYLKRVFIVLDDVDNSMQLDLLSAKNCFGPGSKIIITSRDKHVLEPIVDEIYELKGLNHNESLQLFSLCAFQQDCPKQDFVELSTKMVHFAKGVPLALKVTGSALYGGTKLVWEAYLSKLIKISDLKIDDVLRISYDGLDNEMKNIFLDIACFFKQNSRDYVENILDDCYHNSIKFGISVLIDKSLITVSHNILEMHDLLQQMGWNIVLQESKEPGKRSRLWTPEDNYHVLKNNTGTEMVEGMSVDVSKIREVCINSTTFERMYNLRLLKFYNADFQRERKRKVCLPQHGLESLPDNLRLLHWDDYPSKALPHKFCPYNLVELCMSNSRIERLWNDRQDLPKLKILDLKGSRHLVEIPDLSRAIALECINLRGCESLVRVPSSIGCLSKLKYLDMGNCKRIEELPLSIENLVGLEQLCLNGCEKLKILASSISKLKSLHFLKLNYCSNITKFPEITGNLVMLCLRGTAIEQFPSSIECHSQLDFLSLSNCNLFAFPSHVTCISSLKSLFLSGNSFETIPTSIEQLLNLETLDLSHCENLQLLPASIKQLLNLYDLNLRDCKRLQLLPELPPSLTMFCARDCISLEAVSSSFAICAARNRDNRYSFENCKKLDQNPIWAGTLLGIQQLATEGVKLYQQKDQNPWTPFSICLPGSEIPEWFRFQNEGSSVTIQLPQDLHHRKFVGFALCIVCAPYDDPEQVYPLTDGAKYRCNIKINGIYVGDFFLYPDQPELRRTDHVCVRYDSQWYHDYYREIGYHPNEASFEFNRSGKMIKKCGVRLLYAQDDLTECPHQPNEEYNPLRIQPSAAYDPMVLEDSTTTKRTRDDDYCNDEADYCNDEADYCNDEAKNKRLKA